ncbi:Pkinase-domain-containing protein [Heliocybe sulcata]|uniref:Serine/threonine-protein kinase n=1 Tax=Heliocybe sulcata TaxID=5364 RepID=A0A5C3MXL2_9AGAM|nr:Pkinase-domain-containing protein [Heliocybe sulcata]
MNNPLYTGMPPAPTLPTTRRHPFSNAVNHALPRPPPQTKAQLPEQGDDKGKAKASEPPLPRQNTKAVPPSPPQVIVDKSRSTKYQRIGLLGEGGFARVYEVVDNKHQSRLACKVVTKASLKTKKAKTKLYAEIKIHRALTHPNVVQFLDCFEDDDNVYMTIALCPNGSLMDLLRRRRRFTEPEARVFMVQLLGACHYMHTHQVIHRDLKLGNLLLDAHMNVKVGDFGLAALIEHPGERKKTICGTPNYIAPEVLFDTANGHSFEVDIWSTGVILYTLLIGQAPFQTKEVQSIYNRIRDNQYEFPEHRACSSAAKQLIQAILTRNPSERPTMHDILDHDWFQQGTVPASLPVSIHDGVPRFDHITRTMSQANLATLRREALLDEDQEEDVASRPTAGGKARNNATAEIQRQEQEFQQAVQPGSPISALLKSARQPLVVGNAARESPMFRRLQAVAKEKRASPLKQRADVDVDGERDLGFEEIRRTELESQKARIVAQMAAPPQTKETENAAPAPQPAPGMAKGKQKAKNEQPGVKINGYDAAAETLTAALDALKQGRVLAHPDEEDVMQEGRVFIASWVDYCNKYGMGYALTDGTVGVSFNDSTSLVLSPDKHHFDYVMSRRQGTVYVRKYYTVNDYPEELKSKVYLLKHFEGYIMSRLFGDYDYVFEDTERTKGMDFLQKFLRMKDAIVFKLSNDSLQFNFYDHSKMVLSSHGHVVTHIDKNYKLTRWRLSEVMALALQPRPADADEAKFQQRLVSKVKFCKEVLLSIRKVSEQTEGGGEAEPRRQV